MAWFSFSIDPRRGWQDHITRGIQWKQCKCKDGKPRKYTNALRVGGGGDSREEHPI